MDIYQKSVNLEEVVIDEDRYPPIVSAIGSMVRSNTSSSVDWLLNNRQMIDDLLVKHGVVVFRDFALPSAVEFDKFISVYPRLATGYVGGVGPRAVVTGNVMESSKAPPSRVMTLHQEMSYARDFPGRIAFYCERSPMLGGETTVGDMRELTRRISYDLKQKVKARGVITRRFFRDVDSLVGNPDLDVQHLTWQTAFQTDERGEAQSICENSGCSCEWEEGGLLATFRSSGFEIHPVTKEEIWFNSIFGFGLSKGDLGEEMYDQYNKYYQNKRKPYEVTYGDGTEIADKDADEIGRHIKSITCPHKWKNKDVLLIDNIRTGHGRNTFEGDRMVRVALLQ